MDPTRRPSEAATRARVLVVDDEEGAREALEELLRAEGFATVAVADGEAAVRETRRALPDVVIANLKLPGTSATDLCQKLREIDGDLAVIVTTPTGDMDTIVASLRAGAEDHLVEPLRADAVLRSLERAIARRAARHDQERLRREKEDLHHLLTERLVLSSIREQEYAEAHALQHAQLNALLENLEEGVVIADRGGRLLMINHLARDILGVEGEGPHTLAESHLFDVHDLDGTLLRAEQRPLSRALRGERFVDYEVLRVQPSGERRRVVSTGTCVRDDRGEVALAIVVFRDVTDLRRLERQRDEYLTLISHDLRNPLGSTLVFLSLLKQSLGSSQDANAHLAVRAERSMRRMAAMLDDLAEVTSLESQGLVLHRSACDLREIVASVVDGLDSAHRADRITVETGDANCVVFAD
ncbi:MAG TPA: response regulator, partial [Polyangiaceae bacterium]|nr:response regulator [Polyangiaceae bacterium]